MSVSDNTKIEKKFDLNSWLQETADVIDNADQTQLTEIQTRLQSLFNRTCSQNECGDRETKLYYCSHCKCTHPVCKKHFIHVNQRLCLVCNEVAITRRWCTPYPQL